MERVERYSKGHYIVCAVLDPRVFGAGLTRGGITNARHRAFELIQKHFGQDADASEFILSFNEYTNKDSWNGGVGLPKIIWMDEHRLKAYCPGHDHLHVGHVNHLSRTLGMECFNVITHHTLLHSGPN